MEFETRIKLASRFIAEKSGALMEACHRFALEKNEQELVARVLRLLGEVEDGFRGELVKGFAGEQGEKVEVQGVPV